MIAVILCVVLASDQLTKFLIRAHFTRGEPVPIWPHCFNLTYVGNSGAAWGLFQGQNRALIILSVVTLVVMFVFRRSFATSLPFQKASVGLILGGIFGNLIDRVFHGEVIDFLDFYWQFSSGVKRWPAFNVADSAICIGAFLYIACALWQSKSKAPPTSQPTLDHSPAEIATEQK